MGSPQNDATLNDVAELLIQIRVLLEQRTHPLAELIDREGFAALLNVGVSTLDRLKAGGMIGPKAVELSGVKWLRTEVLSWLTHRDSAGQLLDSATWPRIWASLTRTKNRG